MPKQEKEKIIADAFRIAKCPTYSQDENRNIKIVSLIEVLSTSFLTCCTTTKQKVKNAWSERKYLGEKVCNFINMHNFKL